MATLTQVELWSNFEAAGGTRLRFLPLPAEAHDDIGLDGQDSARAAWSKSLAVVALLLRGRVLRFLFVDGSGTVTWVEWEIRRSRVASGTGAPLFTVDLVGVQDRLRRVLIEWTDGDGFVYADRPAFQLTPLQTLQDVILEQAPAWVQPGSIAHAARTEIQFSKDNALSGVVKYADLLATDWWLEPIGGTAYAVHLGARGASAAPVRIRTGKNLRRLTQEVGGDQVTRMRVFGAEGDDGGPSNLGWAYVEVVAKSGNLVTIAPIHGTTATVLVGGGGGARTRLALAGVPQGTFGAGGGGSSVGVGLLIAFDDQYNHANLGYTVYVRTATGTTTAVVDSIAATQQLQVADASAITVGDWVRLVRSTGGKHLTALDAPAEIAADGIEPGDIELPWDDTVNILTNPLVVDYPTTPGRPAGYGGAAGTWTKETGSDFWLTGGQSAKVVASVGVGTFVLLSKARTWRVETRRFEFSATLWIRITSLTFGYVGLRLTRAGVPIGETLQYQSPINSWIQLKIESASLLADVGTSVAIGFQLLLIGHPVSGAAVTAYVDSVQISPSRRARPITVGSNAARLLEQTNVRLLERRARPVTYLLEAADLERAGLPRTAPLEVGGPVIVDEEELGILGLSARVVRRRRDLRRELLTDVTISTDDRVPGRLAEPKDLVVPFFAPQRTVAADRDDRQAVQTLKAEITATSASTVTITLTHSDLRNGTPAIGYVVYGTVAWVSGSGLGPYVFNRATAASGIGAVIFTAQLPGRTDVTASVEVPEVDYLDVGNITLFLAGDTGSVSARLEGSAPTLSWRYAVSTSAMPADATVDAATPVNGRSLDLTALATLDFGQFVYLKARAFGATGAGGVASLYLTATLRRDNKSQTKTHRLAGLAFVATDPNQPVSLRDAANGNSLGGGITNRYYPDDVYPTALGMSAEAPVLMAKGTTLTRVRGRAKTTSDGTLILYKRNESTGAITSIATATLSFGSEGTFQSSVVSEAVVDGFSYFMRVTLVPSGEYTDDLYWAEIDYTAPKLTDTL